MFLIKNPVGDVDLPTRAAIRSFLDLSTAHITVSDADILKRLATGVDADNILSHDPPLVVTSHDAGWIVVCSGHHTPADWLTYNFLSPLTKIGFSLAFIDLIRYAGVSNYTGLWLDADGPRCEVFPTFVWPGSDDGRQVGDVFADAIHHVAVTVPR